jgi:hypothetical protein
VKGQATFRMQGWSNPCPSHFRIKAIGSYRNLTGCAAVNSFGLAAGLGLAINNVCTTGSPDNINGFETLAGFGAGGGVGVSIQ